MVLLVEGSRAEKAEDEHTKNLSHKVVALIELCVE